MKLEGKFNFNICRVCLENVSKLYPLEGPIPNVDVEVTSMITYCTSIQIELSDDLPNGVCIPCFRTLRIAYNFINQFKDSHKVLTENKWKYGTDVLKIDNEGSEDCYEELLQEHDVEELCAYNGHTLQKYDEYGHIKEIDQLQYNINKEKPNNIEVVIEDSSAQILTLLPENIQPLTAVNTDNVKSSSVQFDLLNNHVELMLKEAHCAKIDAPLKLPKVKVRKKFIQQFSCPLCPGIKHTAQNFLNHISQHQGETFDCNMCSSEDKFNIDEFMYHFVKIHRYQCPFCKKNFSRRGTQYAHMMRHNNIRYSCSFPDCNKSFVTPWRLRKHQNIHSDTIRYSCEKCNVTFKTYDTYRYHLKTHNGRNFLCPFCGKTYLQSVHLKHHLWQHTGLKQFKCMLCSKSYTAITQLKKHNRKFHGNN